MQNDTLLGMIGEFEERIDEISTHERELAKVPPPTGMTEFFGLEPEEKRKRREQLLAEESSLGDRASAARHKLQDHLQALGCKPEVLQEVIGNVSMRLHKDRMSSGAVAEVKEQFRDFCLKVDAAHRATYDVWAREQLISIAGQETAQKIGMNVTTKVR